jgi:hypothetical protein
MRTTIVFAFLAALAGCSSVETKPAAPAAHNTLTDAEKEAGWKLLFDGSTLSGWDDPGSRTPPADSWTIADGCIQSRAHTATLNSCSIGRYLRAETAA